MSGVTLVPNVGALDQKIITRMLFNPRKWGYNGSEATKGTPMDAVHMEAVHMNTARADFVRALEKAQAIAVDGILSGDHDQDWVELDHQISEILAKFPLNVSPEMPDART